MKLSDLRAYVRDQTQTTSGELPDATINRFLQEAFDRTIAMENQWPFFEKTWVLTQPVDAVSMDVPGDMNVPALTALYSDNPSPYRIELIAHDIAREYFPGPNDSSNAEYERFSVWANRIYLWPPAPAGKVRTWDAIGFRRPVDWIAAGPESEPDCDRRLHQALAHYATSLAYAQQEDEQLESVYMQRYANDVNYARSAIMEPAQDRPLIMGPHVWTRIGPPLKGPRRVGIIPPGGS